MYPLSGSCMVWLHTPWYCIRVNKEYSNGYFTLFCGDIIFALEEFEQVEYPTVISVITIVLYICDYIMYLLFQQCTQCLGGALNTCFQTGVGDGPGVPDADFVLYVWRHM